MDEGKYQEYNSKSDNSRPHQANQKAWLIWNGVDDCAPAYGLTHICLNEQDALELYMALVEEELEETFYTMTQDRYEDVNQDWEERAQRLRLRDTLWCSMEVPIYGNLCS